MPLQVVSPAPEPFSLSDVRLDYAREILRTEAAGLQLVASRLDAAFLARST